MAKWETSEPRNFSDTYITYVTLDGIDVGHLRNSDPEVVERIRQALAEANEMEDLKWANQILLDGIKDYLELRDGRYLRTHDAEGMALAYVTAIGDLVCVPCAEKRDDIVDTFLIQEATHVCGDCWADLIPSE